MLKKVPNYIKYIFTNALYLLGFSLIFRLIFFFFFSNINSENTEIWDAFGLGIRFDIKLTVLLIFPLAIFVLIFNDNFFKKRIYKIISTIYLVLCYLVLALFYLTDLGYYDYLSKRLDATSLRFLDNLDISTQMLFESYPVYKGGFGLLIFAFLTYKTVNNLYSKFKRNSNKTAKRTKIISTIATVLILAFGIYNSFSHYPLRWSQAFFSKSNKINQFTLNPVLYFFDSFSFRSDGVNMDKVKIYYPVIAKKYGLPKDTLQFERTVVFPDSVKLKSKPNVVFVMLESVGVMPMGYYKNPLNATPKMDSLMRKSVNFTNFYIHKPVTAGTVFGSVIGLPDIDDVETASRNPLITDQRILFDQFNGYEKLYFLGGSASWANIRSIFKSNVKDIQIFEEGSFETEKRADVWGIDDYELFKESDKELAKLHKQGKPFVAYIQTATNHMPFTVPDKKESYSPIAEDVISDEKLTEAGFDGIDRVNALRYLDFNVDVFLKRAKKAGYYNNTIFLFFGDHNTMMSKTKNFANEFELGSHIHHVPLFINAPKFLTPEVVSKNTNLMDLFPTAMEIAKLNYTNYTLGNNALDSLQSEPFSYLYLSIKGEPAVAIIQDNYFYSRTNVSNSTALYNMDFPTENVEKKHPEIAQRMDSLLQGIYHSTKYLYFNNKKEQE